MDEEDSQITMPGKCDSRGSEGREGEKKRRHERQRRREAEEKSHNEPLCFRGAGRGGLPMIWPRRCPSAVIPPAAGPQ